MIEQFPNEWQKLLKKEEINELTLIQQLSFAKIKQKENVLLLSPTGSGKTLAYLWPALLNVRKDIRNQLVIIAPSQELAIQIIKVARDWAKVFDLKVAQLIGGANIKRQIEKLKKQPEIVVGTPGRLVELMNRRKVRADYVTTLVFDEVDLLLKDHVELNFANQILKKVKRDTQIIAASATLFDDKVLEFLPKDLQIIDVTKEDNSQGKVAEYYLETARRKRVETLKKLAYVPNFQAIVFFNTVQELGVAADKLSYEGIPISTLASDESKFERKMSLEAFKTGQSKLLLTTDLSSRGLDLENLEVVINFDIPTQKENYIHRLGRVGRMGAKGIIINLVNNGELKELKKLIPKHHQLEAIYLYSGELHLEPKK